MERRPDIDRLSMRRINSGSGLSSSWFSVGGESREPPARGLRYSGVSGASGCGAGASDYSLCASMVRYVPAPRGKCLAESVWM